MNQNQQKAFAHDLQAAVVGVMAQHGIMMAKVVAGMDSAGNMTIKIAAPKVTAATGVSEPTTNAVARYKKFGAKLGLPKINTIMMVAGKEYMLMGLSTDGSRVKGRLTQPGAAVTDLPLAAVQAAIADAGAKQVAELDKAEQTQPDDMVDPDVTAFLAAIGKATKPTEGQQ